MMKMLKYCLLTAISSLTVFAFAQNTKLNGKVTQDVSKKNAADNAHDNLNKKDAQNRKQGMWFYEVEALRGEPSYKEFGNYSNDLRNGPWYKLDKEGQLLSIENYKKGVLNGEVQYYTKGKLSCIGHYRGLNPDSKLDSIWVKDPETYIDSMVVVPSERGALKHGIWQYFDPMSGKITREEEYQVDNLIAAKDYEVVSKSDSLLIEQRKAALPHMTNPNGKNPKRRTPKYTY